jgi:hypothetical protein
VVILFFWLNSILLPCIENIFFFKYAKLRNYTKLFQHAILKQITGGFENTATKRYIAGGNHHHRIQLKGEKANTSTCQHKDMTTQPAITRLPL